VKRGRRPPGPSGTLLLGNLGDFRRDYLGTLTRYTREHGDCVGLRLGPYPTWYFSHPDQIEEVLVTQARKLKKPFVQQLVRPLVGDGLLLSEGDKWRKNRRMLQPPFHKARLEHYAAQMVEIATREISRWRDGETRNLHDDMTRVTLAVVARALFDADAEKDGRVVADALTQALSTVAVRMGQAFPLPMWIPTPQNLALRRVVRRLDEIVFQYIAQRRADGDPENNGRQDLLSLLLAARDEEDGSQMTDVEVRDEAMTLFLAGFETTSITLAWSLRLIAEHPAVGERLRSELATVLGGRPATFADMPQLRYTSFVINEAMRLYPPAWGIARAVAEPVEIGGWPIPKGGNIMVAPWVVHRDPRWWDEPEAFKPERWEGDLQKRLHKFAFFPFGGGPRVCIGNGFALMESVLVLATIASRYALEAIGPRSAPEVQFTLRPKGGVKLKLRALAPAVRTATA
jgi:cytochrome P450